MRRYGSGWHGRSWAGTVRWWRIGPRRRVHIRLRRHLSHWRVRVHSYEKKTHKINIALRQNKDYCLERELHTIWRRHWIRHGLHERTRHIRSRRWRCHPRHHRLRIPIRRIIHIPSRSLRLRLCLSLSLSSRSLSRRLRVLIRIRRGRNRHRRWWRRHMW